uniref:Protein EMBRYONIC FLOWER 1-like n=1 Tax=Nicotiana tabacum TaxID=4097 RepID=A0A1S3XMZ0_TOBAC|nr:PREDICTED: uncharacterized protein LOC107766699 [Nicotiana tabacum]
MAVSIDGFSIREYTAKMRSVDVVKCWPFDESTKDVHVRAMLPPIAVKKFSWWLDVLELSDDNVDSDVIPVTRIRTARKTKAIKGKAKVQKKRSIIDIFAVAPQVERMDDGDYYDDEDDDHNCDIERVESSDRNVSAIRNSKNKKRNTKKKTKKKEKTIVSKLKEVNKGVIKKGNKRITQKKRVNSNCLDLLIQKKEKFDKLKVPSSFSKPSCPQHSRNCGNDMADYTPTYGKKAQRTHLVSEKKTKGLIDSKFSAKHQKTVIPVCSNLKKRTKRFPVENSTGGILSGPSDVNFCSNQQGDKHVPFSDCVAERGEVVSLVEEKGTNKFILRKTENEVSVRPGSPKQLSAVCSTADEPGLHRHNIGIKDDSFECCDIFNQVAEGNGNLKLFRRGYGVASHGSQYLCNPGTLHAAQQIYNHQKKAPIDGSLINACGANERSHEQLKGSLHELAGICSMHSVKAYPHQSSAYEILNRKPILLPQTITGSCTGHIMQYQPFPQISPQGLMCKVCSLPEWKQRESMYGEKGIEENHVGLPLNSQGELINLNSNGERKLTQLPSSREIVGSSRGLAVTDVALSKCMDNLPDARGHDKRAPPKDQLKLSFVDDSMQWNPTFPVPSRLGIYEYDAGRTNVELDPRKENEQSITSFELDRHVSNFSNHGSKQDDQAKQFETTRCQQYGNSDHVSLLVTPSKMRLMGKEFTVGKRDFHVPQDKRIWTDKQIIAENFSADNDNYNSVVTNHDQQKLTVHPVLGTLKGLVACSPSIRINQAIPQPWVCSPDYSHQIDSVQHNHLGAIKQSPFTVYNHKPNFEEPFTGGYKSFTISPYAPGPTAVHHYSSQNGGSSSVVLNSSNCAINSPFLHPNSGTNFRSPWSQLSSECTPWFSDAKEKKILMDFHELYSTSDRNHHHCSISGDNRQIDHSVYVASERFCSFTQRPALENPVASPSLANYPPMPLQIGSKANAGTKKRHGDVMKLKEKIISTPCLRETGYNREGKKKPLSASDNCTNAKNIPNLMFQEDPSAVAPLNRHSKFEGRFGCRQALESGLVKGMAKSIESGQSGTPDAGLGSFNSEDTLKYDCSLRSGPIKLTAGAKHVLKPCQYNDQKNFRPTHSTIQFGASTAGSTTLETENPTKIYKF